MSGSFKDNNLQLVNKSDSISFPLMNFVPGLFGPSWQRCALSLNAQTFLTIFLKINPPGQAVAFWSWQKPSKETTWISFLFLSMFKWDWYWRVWQHLISALDSPKSWNLSCCRKLGFSNSLWCRCWEGGREDTAVKTWGTFTQAQGIRART